MEKFCNSILKFPFFYYSRKLFNINQYNPAEKHPPSQYVKLSDTSYPLMKEVFKAIDIVKKNKAVEKIKVLDLACGPGRHLDHIRQHYNCRLFGVDINPEVLIVMHDKFPDLEKDGTVYIESLKNFFSKNTQKYDVVYTHGRSIDLIPPNFNLVREISKICTNYFIMINIANSGKSHKRFWELEFKINDFQLIKHFFPESSYSKPIGKDRPFLFQIYKRISL